MLLSTIAAAGFAAARAIHQGRDLGPQGGGIGLEAMQEAGEGIVRGCVAATRLDASRFDATDSARGGDEEIDVVRVGAAWWIHANYSTRFCPPCSTA